MAAELISSYSNFLLIWLERSRHRRLWSLSKLKPKLSRLRKALGACRLADLKYHRRLLRLFKSSRSLMIIMIIIICHYWHTTSSRSSWPGRVPATAAEVAARLVRLVKYESELNRSLMGTHLLHLLLPRWGFETVLAHKQQP